MLCNIAGSQACIWAPNYFRERYLRWEGWTDLALASYLGVKQVVQMLLDEGANVNLQGGEYGTALQAASAGGHSEVVQMLLDNGADVNLQSGKYGTALHAASGNGHEAVVQLLLEQNGLELNSKDNNGRTLLSWAWGTGKRPSCGCFYSEG